MSDLDPTTSTVRGGLLQREVLRILDERGTTPRSDVLAAIPHRLDLTPHELERSGKHQNPRFYAFVTWGSTEMRAAGWIDKESAGWVITPAGREALNRVAAAEDFAAISRAAWKQADDRRKATLEYQAPAFGVADAAVGSLEPGEWTTYTDIAELAGISPGQVGDFLRVMEQVGGHRVIQYDGRPNPTYPWFTDRTPRQALEEEGVTFDAAGVASAVQRVTTEDLRDRLEPLDVLPRPSRRAWLVRGTSAAGRELLPGWFELGVVTLGAAKLRAVTPGIGRDELKVVIDEDYAHTSYSARRERLDELHAFLTRMSEDDVVATIRQGRLHVGTITGPPERATSADGETYLSRTATWVGSDEGVDFADLAADLASRLRTQRDVVDLTQQLETLESLSETEELQLPPPTPEPLRLRDADDELATQLHVDRDWLQECIDLLNDRPQLIFYGPPGTGKTYIAQKLAAHVANESVRLVQFHPAYSYEDFFEGYRPQEGGGFKLQGGPMRKVVDAALKSPDVAHVLIIDEINRGNLAKVFGELYFLLEYRDESVDLLYAEDDSTGFNLPSNVFIIGTMNTADRSIALVDAAMRRRFAFVPLHPSEPPTDGVLRSWLRTKGHDKGVAGLLDELNRRIDDPDFQVGPSYFMRAAVHEGNGLARTWRTQILPLLEEHHHGELTRAEVSSRYGLDAVKAAVAPRSDGDDGAPPDPH